VKQEPCRRPPIALPFTGLSQDVAVDSAGNIYITDCGNGW
jgi:NHL repeat